MATLAEVSRSRMLESVYDRFEAAWQRREEPDIEEFAAELKDDSHREQVLHELALIDLEYRWRRAASAHRSPTTCGSADSVPNLNHPGHKGLGYGSTGTNLLLSPFAANGRPFLEDYIERWPEFGPFDRLPISAIVHEFRVRCDAGDTPELAEYFRRFPIQARGLHDALQLEVEDRLNSTRSIQATQPLESASTGPIHAAPTSNQDRSVTRRLTPGDQLGRYRILWPVGHGAMGTVYLAYDPDLDRQIAIKVPFLDGPHAERLTQRFRREAKLTASLRHPNICRVLDVDRQGGIDFLTMDYVDGTSLETLLKSGPLMPPVQAVQIVRKIASALQEAHAAGVIHRDVKPSNILIDRRGEPVLTDFGLARRPEVDASEQTRPGEWLGTPAYMAPEQFSGNSDDVTPGCDIFSLGVVLYRLLTGQRPFGDGHRREDIAQRTPPAMPHLLRAGLSARLSKVCLQALRFDPRERFSSAGEFASALEPFANERPVEPSQHGSAIVAVRRRRSLPIHFFVRILMLLLVGWSVVVGGYAAWVMFREDVRPPISRPTTASTSNSAKETTLRFLPRVELHVQRASQSEGYQVLGPEIGSLKDGDKMQFHVTLDEPAFVALFYVDADGVVSRRWPIVGHVSNVPGPPSAASSGGHVEKVPHEVKEVWDPPLAAAGELQEMHVLGDKAGIELIVAVASSRPFDETSLSAIERLRLNPIKSTAGFSFVARRDTPSGDEAELDSTSASVRLTTLPLGANPRLFGLAANDKTRAISGRTSTQKSEWLDWEQFAERLAHLGEFCHGSAFHHAP